MLAVEWTQVFVLLSSICVGAQATEETCPESVQLLQGSLSMQKAAVPAQQGSLSAEAEAAAKPRSLRHVDDPVEFEARQSNSHEVSEQTSTHDFETLLQKKLQAAQEDLAKVHADFLRRIDQHLNHGTGAESDDDDDDERQESSKGHKSKKAMDPENENDDDADDEPSDAESELEIGAKVSVVRKNAVKDDKKSDFHALVNKKLHDVQRELAKAHDELMFMISEQLADSPMKEYKEWLKKTKMGNTASPKQERKQRSPKEESKTENPKQETKTLLTHPEQEVLSAQPEPELKIVPKSMAKMQTLDEDSPDFDFEETKETKIASKKLEYAAMKAQEPQSFDDQLKSSFESWAKKQGRMQAAGVQPKAIVSSDEDWGGMIKEPEDVESGGDADPQDSPDIGADDADELAEKP